MNRPFHLWFMAPGSPEGQDLFEQSVLGGQTTVADLFLPDPREESERLDRWLEFTRGRGSSWPTRYGLRLSCRAAGKLDTRAPGSPGVLVLVGENREAGLAEHLRAWKRSGGLLCWEYSPGMTCPLEPALLDSIVVRGCESGGISRDQSVRTLFDLARHDFPDAPLLVQGVASPQAAAVFLLLGAAGHILDSSLFNIAGHPVCDEAVGAQGGRREAGLRRFELNGHWADVHYSSAAGGDPVTLPLGPGMLLAEGATAENPSGVAATFRQETNSLLGRLVRTEPETLRSTEADPLLVQGPMAGISRFAGFASAVADAGFFPVLSLTGLDAGAIGELGREMNGCDRLSAFGIGIAGPTEFDPDDLDQAFAQKQATTLLLSADQWTSRAMWRKSAENVWLHIQTPEMLDLSLEEGYTHFILEGGESGGHVGRLSSLVLWDRMLRHIASLNVDSSAIHLVFAGGLHSAESLLFAALLAAAFKFRGSLSFQLGSSILLSHDAVDCGSIHPGYQRRMLSGGFTSVAGSGTGAGVRFVSGGDKAVEAEEREDADYLAAYLEAVRGGSGIVLAGESIAHFTEPIDLAGFAAELGGYRHEWARIRETITLVDTLDFRTNRTLPVTDLAVVGMGGIFPGADDVEEFWDNLENHRRHIVEVPPEHWGPGDYRARNEKDEKEPYEKSYSWHAGMIQNFCFNRFDCLKYSISPKAVESTDRIHLMILKAVGAALESAGSDFAMPGQDTVVLIGNSMGGERAKLQTLRVHVPDMMAMLDDIPEYSALDSAAKKSIERQFREKMFRRMAATTEDTLVGIVSSTLAGRVASYLNVLGGNFAVDAACAASLAGLAAAVEMLDSGTCECAVVGGVDSDLSIGTFINFCRLRALAHGISRPFMVGSDGFTMGEGAGAIFLKPFDRAVKDGDRIFARIAGIGLSSDGRVGSMTLPSSEGQVLALRRAFARSGFPPSSIGMIEAHGTGTAVGDAVELETLRTVFEGVPARSIAIGSVKAFVGHLKSAAGMASLVKAIMALRTKTLPPALVEGEIRPELREPGTPFKLLEESEVWHRDGFLPRRAAVSAFGFGGSNVHVHLEEMDERLRHLSRSRLLMFSGKNVDDVMERLTAFDRAVTERGVLDLNDPAQTASLGGIGRCRLAGVWKIEQPWSEMLAAFRAAAAGSGPGPGILFSRETSVKKISFLFPGQGSAVYGPFRQMMDSVALFRYDMEHYGKWLDMDLVGLLWPAEEKSQADARRLANPLLQPATTALELALIRMLRRLGVVPDAVCGHSLGFYAALAAAGSLGEKDVLELVRLRAECFDSLTGPEAGCMLALSADEDRVMALRDKAPVEFFPANFNSPCQTVISMRGNDLDAVARFLDEAQVDYQRLPVAWGFHSPLMEPAAAAFEKHLRKMPFRAPDCDLYSETTAGQVDAGMFDAQCPDWLPEHIIRPVRFAGMIEAMRRNGCDYTLEVGARGTLTRFVKDSVGQTGVCCQTLDSTSDDVIDHLNEVLASLYVEAGAGIDTGSYLDVFAGHLKPVRIGGARPVVVADPMTNSPDTEPSGSAGDSDRPAQDINESDAVYQKTRAMIARCSGFETAQITSDQLIQETLGLDSLKMVEIGIEIEKTFGITIQSSAFPRSLTVGGLAGLIREHQGEPGPRAKPELNRYVLERRIVPFPEASATEKGRIGLLTNSAGLAGVWRSAGYGPACSIDDYSIEGLHAAADSLVPSTGQSYGLIYAVVDEACEDEESLLKTVFLPAYALGHDLLAGIAACGTSDGMPFSFRTASLRSGRFAPGDALSGFSRSLQLEFPGIRCGHVTVRLDAGLDAGLDAAAELLWREISGDTDLFAFVTHEGGNRYVEDLCGGHDNVAREPLLSDRDVVLVSGGGHGITAETILGLSEGVSPHWIITGSTDPADGSEKAQRVNETMTALRGKGCRVDYLPCDFSSLDNVRALVEQCREQGIELTGVIHGAGVIEDGTIEGKCFDDFLRVLTVKAGSAMVLQNRLDCSRLKFWINFSSIASFTGNHGQTDYAAANAFLNSQAEALRKDIAAVSILWGPWRGVGMAVDDLLERAIEARGIGMIDPDVGVDFVRRELTDGDHPVVALCSDPVEFIPPQSMTSPGLWAERRVCGAHLSLVSRSLDLEEPILRDHVIEGIPVLPGVMALEFSASAMGRHGVSMCWNDLVFNRMIRPVEGQVRIVLDCAVEHADSTRFEGRQAGGDKEPAFSGVISWKAGRPEALAAPEPGKTLRRWTDADLYGDTGLLFSGPLFRVLMAAGMESPVTVYDNCVQAALTDSAVPPYTDPGLCATVPLALLDGLFQMAALQCASESLGAFIPVGVDSLWWSGESAGPGEMWARVWFKGEDGDGVRIFDAAISKDGKEWAVARAVRMASIGAV